MDILEMHVQVDLGLQRIGSNALENFLSEEIDAFLNDAINKYLKANALEIRTVGDNHVAAHENLRTLVKYDSIDLAGHNLPNSKSGTLPSDFHLFLAVNLEGTTSNKHYRGEYLAPHEYLRSLPTESDDPVFRHLPVTMIENGLVAAVDSVVSESIDTAHLLYVKAPVTVVRDDTTPSNNVNCDLPDHAHQEIVDTATMLMLKALQNSGTKRDDGT